MRIGTVLLATAGLAALGAAGGTGWAQQSSPTFAEQVEQGRSVYAANCSVCHGEGLAGGQFATALKGPEFLGRWGDLPASELTDYITTSMPPGGGGSLSSANYAALTALILSENGGAPASLADARFPAVRRGQGEEGGGLGLPGISNRYPFPASPEPVDRLASYTPVTQAELVDPAPENWLNWRRSQLGQGFSPLDQVTLANVDDLQIAWAQALPAGATMSEPLVRDGVMFMYGWGDEVFAFDAASGRQLWRYRRQMPEGTLLQGKKTISLWGDTVILATSDLHMMALDARTGSPGVGRGDSRCRGHPQQWRPAGGGRGGDDRPRQPARRRQHHRRLRRGKRRASVEFQHRGAGRHARRRYLERTAQPGTPRRIGVDQRLFRSANWPCAVGRGADLRYRAGARSCCRGRTTTGSTPIPPSPSNRARGELVWYYQHMANDQYDLDWVFERVIGEVEVDGQPRRVVITGGKEGLFDTIDAATGRYIDTVDMGFQTFITADRSGDRAQDPRSRAAAGA